MTFPASKYRDNDSENGFHLIQIFKWTEGHKDKGLLDLPSHALTERGDGIT